MKRLASITLMLALLMLTGCLGKQVPYADVQPETGKASVYVYRLDSFINRSETMILEINGNEHGQIGSGFYLHAFSAPGDANVILKKNVFPYNEYGSIKLTGLEAGKSYYVKADPVAMGGFDMELMDEETGRKEAMQTKKLVLE